MASLACVADPDDENRLAALAAAAAPRSLRRSWSMFSVLVISEYLLLMVSCRILGQRVDAQPFCLAFGRLGAAKIISSQALHTIGSFPGGRHILVRNGLSPR
jgi:hypothetical protein